MLVKYGDRLRLDRHPCRGTGAEQLLFDHPPVYIQRCAGSSARVPSRRRCAAGTPAAADVTFRGAGARRGTAEPSPTFRAGSTKSRGNGEKPSDLQALVTGHAWEQQASGRRRQRPARDPDRGGDASPLRTGAARPADCEVRRPPATCCSRVPSTTARCSDYLVPRAVGIRLRVLVYEDQLCSGEES